MPHRDPLTAADLAAIWDREPTDTVKELLWEIHRLRSIVLRANQLISMSKSGPVGPPETVWEAFKITISKEPVLTDPPTPRTQAIIDAARRKREGERK